MQKKFLLFDFDGVLTDSFNQAFSVTKTIRPWITTEEEYRDLFMGNVYEVLASHEKSDARLLTTQVEDGFFVKYFELMKHVDVIPAMREIIPILAESHRLIIISSAYGYIINDVLERGNLLHHFEEILGSDVERNKTKKIQTVFDRHGVDSSHALFITDTAGDVKEAHKVNLDSIAVTWGYHNANRLLTAEPFAIVDSPQELLVTIQNR
jgi:phosphoglycolate phosphatase